MDNLRKCREQSKLSQKQVALEIGVKPPTVCQWEKGIKAPSRENIAKLAKLYQVSIDYLLGEDSNAEDTDNGDSPSLTSVQLAQKIDRLPTETQHEIEKYIDYLLAQARRDP